MSSDTQETARQLALEIVRKLRDDGYEAYWAGGCVRDQLLGHWPKDYDVATSATPDAVRACFGKRRTLAIGAAFGVIAVRGRGGAQVEVATFRTDGTYSDGRRPDHVTFADAETDARRRDFTINGMFYDPIEHRVLDFVGGEADLRAGVVRAIGNPSDRIAEDRLRMLRAVRFAAAFAFELDPSTEEAIRRDASHIGEVSGERIAGEVERMLVHPHRSRALELLRRTALLRAILPATAPLQSEPERWRHAHTALERLECPTFSSTLAAVLYPLSGEPEDLAAEISRRWRLSNQVTKRVAWLLRGLPVAIGARDLPWSQVQPWLASDGVEELLDLVQAIDQLPHPTEASAAWCAARVAWPRERLDPPPLLDGGDLQQLGLEPGPQFGRLLGLLRTAQLDGELTSHEQAVDWVRRHAGESTSE